MKKLLTVALLMGSLISFQGNHSDALKTYERTKYNQIIEDEDFIPKADRPIWYAVDGGFTENSSKWRVGLIEQRYVVEVAKHKATYHSDEIIAITSDLITLMGATSFSITNKVSFESQYSIVTSEQIKVSGEATLGVGAKVDGFEASASLSAQASYTHEKTTTYSTKYSKENSVTVNYSTANIPGIQNNTLVAGCIAGDFISGTARIKKIAYWWWGTEIVEDWRSFDFQIVTRSYVTYCLSNGWFASRNS